MTDRLATSTWKVLRAGGFRLDGGGMFGLIPRTMWSRWMPPDADNRIGLSMNCVLIERAGEGGGGRVRRTLVETGAGGKWTPKEEAIYEFQRAADGRTSRGLTLSAASMSSRSRCSSASLNRWAMLDEGRAPKPSRRSETKKRRSPAERGAEISSAWMNTTPNFHQSSDAMASWLK